MLQDRPLLDDDYPQINNVARAAALTDVHHGVISTTQTAVADARTNVSSVLHSVADNQGGEMIAADTPLLGKRRRRDKHIDWCINQSTNSLHSTNEVIQADESQEPTNESSFNKLSDGGMTQFSTSTISIEKISINKKRLVPPAAGPENGRRATTGTVNELKCLE